MSRRTSMAAAGGAVKSAGCGRDGVRLAAVVREQGVAVDGLPRPSQPADHQGADAMGAGTVGRYRHSGPLELRPKAYRPVAHGQHRAASPLAPRGEPLGQLGGRDRDAAPSSCGDGGRRRRRPRRGARRSPPARAVGRMPGRSSSCRSSARRRRPAPRGSRRRRPAGRGPARARARWRSPSRRPVKPPGPVPTQMRPTSSQPTPGLRQRLLEQRLQRSAWRGRSPGAGSSRRSISGRPAASTATEVARGRRVDADDRAHGSISIRRWSPPACASRTRCATRSAARRRRRARATRRTRSCRRRRTDRAARGPRPPSRRACRGRGARADRRRPSCRWPTTNVGDVTGPSTPRLRSAPRTNVVLPAPSSPETSTTSPGFRRAASCRPGALGVFGSRRELSRVTEARAQREAGAQQQRPAGGGQPVVDARVRQRGPGARASRRARAGSEPACAAGGAGAGVAVAAGAARASAWASPAPASEPKGSEY